MNNKRDGFEQDGVLGVGVLDLLGFGRLLRFVQDGFQTFHQPTFNSAILWWRVTLQQAQQLAGQPGCGHKVVGVVLEVGGCRGHDLNETRRLTCKNVPRVAGVNVRRT